MNRLWKWIESLYEPEKTNFRDAALEDLIQALNSPAVRQHWISALVDELRAINVGVDRSLREGDFFQMPERAARRGAIVFCLNQILESQTALNTEILEKEERNNPRRSQGPSWFGRFGTAQEAENSKEPVRGN